MVKELVQILGGQSGPSYCVASLILYTLVQNGPLHGSLSLASSTCVAFIAIISGFVSILKKDSDWFIKTKNLAVFFWQESIKAGNNYQSFNVWNPASFQAPAFSYLSTRSDLGFLIISINLPFSLSSKNSESL